MFPQPDPRITRMVLISPNPGYTRMLEALAHFTASSPTGLGELELIDKSTYFDTLPLLALGLVDVLAVDQDHPEAREAQARLHETDGGRSVTLLVLTRSDLKDFEESEPIEALTRLEAALSVALERRRAYQEAQRRSRQLEASEARLKRVIESNVDGIIIIDPQGVIRFVNRAVEALFGKPREDLLNRTFGFPIVEGEHTELQLACRGEERIAELRVVDIQWEGKAASLAFLRDITSRQRAERALRTVGRRNAQLVAAVSSLNLGVVICDGTSPGWPLIFANHGFCEITGYSLEEVRGSSLRILQGKDTDPLTVDNMREALRNVRSWRGELLNYRKDGAPFWNSLTLNPVFDPEGNLLSVVGVLKDVSDQIRSAQALRDSEANLQALIESTSDIICSINRSCQIITCNATFRRTTIQLTGVELGRGTYILEYLDPTHRETWHQHFQRAFDGASFAVENSLRLTGRTRHFEVCFSPIRTPDGRITGATVFARDITERKQAEAQLLHNAFHDALTSLPNRALLSERLERALTRNRGRDGILAVLWVGIDRFKNIVDYMGYASGDQVLIALARRLESLLRPSDTVARMAGDEFTVLLEDIKDLGDALRVSERIHHALLQPIQVGTEDVYVTASIGLAFHGEESSSSHNLLRDAANAMVRAKREGRNRTSVFNETDNEDVRARLELELDLRRALGRNELVLHYQPIIHLATGELAGFEALLRWNHPTRKSVPPDKFIKIAEEGGLIDQIGQFVLETAARQVRQWQLRFPRYQHLTISVNLSPRQSLQEGLVAQVVKALEESGLNPHQLKLEITESTFIENTAKMRAMMQQLADLGVHIQLDDFGTGYSNLSILHELPVQTLKIDQSFVKRLGVNGENTAFIQIIRSLAIQLSLTVVAEGVEFPHQADFLRRSGCEFGQGYYFARPMATDQIEHLLQGDLLPWNEWTSCLEN